MKYSMELAEDIETKRMLKLGVKTGWLPWLRESGRNDSHRRITGRLPNRHAKEMKSATRSSHRKLGF